jgi:hypothetical protein
MIDIIVLTYNNLDSTKKCIDHLYQFTDEFNLIIVDNNSTDGTVEYLKDIDQENLTLHFSPKNLGCVMGRNFAYTLSKDSEYICFLDNDQFVLSDWVESYMYYIDRGAHIVGAEGWQMRDNFIPYRKVSKGENHHYVGCGGMFLKREIIDDIGLFDLQYNPMYFEDPDFCWRANSAGYNRICWNEKQRILHKPHKLLDAQRKVFFNDSHRLFRSRWRGRQLPYFSNYVDK